MIIEDRLIYPFQSGKVQINALRDGMYLLENLLAQATIVITPLHVWDSLLSLREVSMHHRQNKTYCDRKSTSSIPVSQSVTMCHNVSKCDMIIYMIILAPWHSPLFVLGTSCWWLLGWLTLVEWLGKKLMAQNHLATCQTILFIWYRQPMATDPNSPKLSNLQTEVAQSWSHCTVNPRPSQENVARGPRLTLTLRRRGGRKVLAAQKRDRFKLKPTNKANDKKNNENEHIQTSEGIKKKQKKPNTRNLSAAVSHNCAVWPRGCTLEATPTVALWFAMSWHSWRKHSDCSFLALAFASLSNTKGEVGIWRSTEAVWIKNYCQLLNIILTNISLSQTGSKNAAVLMRQSKEREAMPEWTWPDKQDGSRNVGLKVAGCMNGRNNNQECEMSSFAVVRIWPKIPSWRPCPKDRNSLC